MLSGFVFVGWLFYSLVSVTLSGSYGSVMAVLPGSAFFGNVIGMAIESVG